MCLWAAIGGLLKGPFVGGKEYAVETRFKCTHVFFLTWSIYAQLMHHCFLIHKMDEITSTLCNLF